MLKKLRGLVRSLGATGALLYLLARVVDGLVPRGRMIYYLIVVQPVPSRRRLPPERGAGFEFRVLREPEPLLESLGRPAHIIEARFRQGSHCLVATRGGAFAGCIWLHFGPYVEDEVATVFVPARSDMSWDYDVYVAETYRVGFLFARLWEEAADYLRERGVRFTASRISGFNERSIQSHRRMGAVTVQRVCYLLLGPVQLSVASRRPRVWLCRSTAGAPRFTVPAPAAIAE